MIWLQLAIHPCTSSKGGKKVEQTRIQFSGNSLLVCLQHEQDALLSPCSPLIPCLCVLTAGWMLLTSLPSNPLDSFRDFYPLTVISLFSMESLLLHPLSQSTPPFFLQSFSYFLDFIFFLLIDILFSLQLILFQFFPLL